MTRGHLVNDPKSFILKPQLLPVDLAISHTSAPRRCSLPRLSRHEQGYLPVFVRGHSVGVMDRPALAPLALTCTLALALASCGDDTGMTVSASASGSSTQGPTTVTPTTAGPGSDSDSDATPTSAGSGSASDSDATTQTPTTDPSTSSGPGTTTTGVSASSTTGDGTTVGVDDSGTSGASSTGDPMKLDVGVEDCEVKCGNTDWSYVWIANSGEHTLSKLDTRNITEEGRYHTRPDHQGNPSRTSVSIDGKAVAVANRSGGLTKVWARKEFCEDKNGNGQIETSTGKLDVLPFGQDECVAWYTPFPDATSQRPVAWTSGVYNPKTCEYEDQKIWTAAANGQKGATWPCDGSPGIVVYRVDGDTGTVEDTIPMPDVTCGGTLGPYGAAVDADNDLWLYIWSAGKILHVDHDTLAYETYNGGSYGITVDKKGRVWIDSGQRFDPLTKIWSNQIGNQPGNGGSGVAEDLKGRIWKATAGGVGWVDGETMVVGDTVLLPIDGLARGIGVDIDGYIWAVMLGGTTAYRIHPDTYKIDTYAGLNQPYTYSDMAGGQINKIVCPQ